jgi:hypothetical protein
LKRRWSAIAAKELTQDKAAEVTACSLCHMARLDSVVERSDEISFNIDIYGVTVDSVVKFIRTKPILYTRMTRVEDMRSV